MQNADNLFIPSEPWLLIFEGDEPSFLTLLSKSIDQNILDDAIFRVDCSKSRCLNGLFDELASALSLPEYFGRNFNALYDCLNDLDWLERRCYVLLLTNASELLADESEDAFYGFVEILRDAAKEWSNPIDLEVAWKRPAIPFHAVFIESTECLNLIEARIRKIECSVGKIINP